MKRRKWNMKKRWKMWKTLVTALTEKHDVCVSLVVVFGVYPTGRSSRQVLARRTEPWAMLS